VYPAYGSNTSAQTVNPGLVQLTGSSSVESLLSTDVTQRSEEWAFEISGNLVGHFTVNTTDDNSDSSPGDGMCVDAVGLAGAEAPTTVSCSLRAAIEEANALGGVATIGFSPALDGNPITLGSQLPAITTNQTITGNGAAATIVQASACDPVALPGACTPAGWRVFEVGAGGKLSLAGTTVRHGNVMPDGDGGAILNGGTLSVSAVTVTANNAGHSGGGIENGAAGTIDAIVASTFSGNQAGYNGGGVDNYSGGTITQIAASHFTSNTAWYGAGLYAGIAGQVSNTAFAGNTALYYGGGIYADGDLALIDRCTFDANSSGEQGGGLYTDSTNAVGAIVASLFTGNSSQYGGGLREYDGSMGTIANSTFSGNTATVEGGAIETKSGTIAGIFNVTVTGNTSPLGAGIYTESNVPITNSIFGDNSGGANCEGTFSDVSGNFSDDSSCASAGSIVPGTDYSLTLADNGGPTMTHALLAGSPARDADGACPAELNGVDQRGFARDDNCDSGAFEANVIFVDGFEGN